MEEEPNPVHSPPQNSVTPLTNDRYERIMSNLRASVFSKITPSGDIAPQIKTYIEKRLREFFPSFHTPSHPPYASMILRAISELNDEGGSTEEAISAFIKREYEHLPWGHESFLSHHLRKLCRNLEIECVNNGRYMLLFEDCEFKEMTGASRKKQGRRGRQGRKKGRAKEMKKQRQAENQQIEVYKEPWCQETLQAMELKQHKDQKTSLERDVEMGFNKQDDVQDFVTQNLDYDHPAVEEEKQLQITSPCEKREIICGLLSVRHPQPKNLSHQQMRANLHPVESSSFLESCTDPEQHLDLSTMKRSPKPKAPVNKNILTSSFSYPQHQYEQQQSKPRGRGRPRKLKSDTDMIKKSLLPSSDHGCNEQQQQLEGPGNGRCPVPESNLVADATTSSHSHDQNHNEQQQPLRKTGGRLPKRKRKCC
ncbi:hypothetical protein P3X46_032923 [Hevea brasiliensis]|uniref:H15 domain-containing protein n=1 Tax=Hevea brasiliensis TaxID=3981 RepID=A0ABQ9KET5_HEVBR|nr:uncharacterized protein LOC110662927 isoform X1 [Hevea brasiliensis]XP_057996711.1 uncharacterized protein LOC110662927 isoform X1 [Hevea brasiliensis]XP_057996712.1 uncharacterized protein LOC110662927 isoform X1 [Hevea brasiliensis]XP_057996713.1 uncharacterized protein LOC110662927 isoform X1 [Hevea brasiliensis]KAJ9135781.1 hypothetical protein P3X46_032923 [Hevea brasiliensis]KAJ9135783.1 hypothetical protein P3X46_032923 [Hevea brasiliensis]